MFIQSSQKFEKKILSKEIYNVIIFGNNTDHPLQI